MPLGAQERNALAELYRAHLPRVRARARGVTGGDWAAAQDVAQDVFLAYVAYARRQPVDRPSALLRLMAVQQAHKRMRRDALLSGPAPRGRPADPRPHGVEERLALVEALDRVEPAAARMLWLHHVGGLDHDEIAAQLHLPRRQVGRTLERARGRARRLLGADLGPRPIAPAPPLSVSAAAPGSTASPQRQAPVAAGRAAP